MEGNSSKYKRSIKEICPQEGQGKNGDSDDIANVGASGSCTATNMEARTISSKQKNAPKKKSSPPVFHQPPEKRSRRSFSPVHSNSPGDRNRGELTPPRDILVPNHGHGSRQSSDRQLLPSSPSAASASSTNGQGPMGSPPPAPASLSPRGAGLGGASPQVRRLGMECAGVGILRDGAGWPGFGSEEEMGMSSSGAEEDERNNKYAGFEWQWDDTAKSSACCLAKMKTEVRFHLDYSCGTAAARGSETMRDGQFFWEVKMVSPVYGTDMMIGVGTKQVDLNQYSRAFCSMLGHEAGSESCGLSYTGRFQKGGVGRRYCSKFGQGAIIGMHLDMWFGTLTYYKSGKYLGVATRNLLGKTWYPIVSSTAARSSMRLVNTKSFPSNLQFWCCQALRRAVPPEKDVLEALKPSLPPGLRSFLDDNLAWLLRPQEVRSGAGGGRGTASSRTKATQTTLSMTSKCWKESEEGEEEEDDEGEDEEEEEVEVDAAGTEVDT